MTSAAPTTTSTSSLSDVGRVVGGWCDRTDPALYTGAEAAVAVEGLARVVRRLQAKQAGFAARVEECHSQPRQFVSCDDYLARVNGSSRGDAKRAIDTARRLRQCPAASAAFEQGDLSVGEADEIAAAVVLDPSAEEALVATATTTHDLAETRDRARKVKAAARRGEDPALRRARVRAKRRWSEFDDDDMKAIAARFAPEDWARIKPVVDAYTRAVFERARRLGFRDPHEAYRADGVLAALAAAGEALGLDLTPRTAKAATATAAKLAVPARSTATTDTTRTAATGAEFAGTESAGTAATDAESTDAESAGTAATEAESRGTAATGAESTGTAAREAESTGAESDDACGGARRDRGTTAATESPPAPPAPADPAGAIESELDELDELLGVRPSRVKWNVTVLVDAIALQRGYATASETCEIPGFGPINVDVARQILPDAMVDVLVHDLVDIKAYATLTRYRRVALDKALQARDRRCVVPSCKRRGHLQVDHRHDHAKGGPTSYDNLAFLCEVHHHEKTHLGARLERVDDEWHWYPPPPAPGQPRPPPGTIPWRAKVGQHLTAFDLTNPPPPIPPGPGPDTEPTLPFG